jgi:hypothetical protein
MRAVHADRIFRYRTRSFLGISERCRHRWKRTGRRGRERARLPMIRSLPPEVDPADLQAGTRARETAVDEEGVRVPVDDEISDLGRASYPALSCILLRPTRHGRQPPRRRRNGGPARQ